MELKPLTLKVRKDIWFAWKIQAAREETTMSELAERLVSGYIDVWRERAAKSGKGLPYSFGDYVRVAKTVKKQGWPPQELAEMMGLSPDEFLELATAKGKMKKGQNRDDKKRGKP